MKSDTEEKYLQQVNRVIDWRYAIIVFFWRMIPRRIWKQLPIRTGQKPTEKNSKIG